MIPIKIENSKLNEIKLEYKEMVFKKIIDGRKNDINQKSQIENICHIIDTQLQEFKVTQSFDNIILADFRNLKKIKDVLDLHHNIFDAYKGKDSSEKYVKGSPFDSLYTTYDKLDNNWLIKRLGITVCPYCNRDFINNRGSSTSAQLDHFYPRSKYPIFALSLFNLIPSCYVCNHTKAQQEIDVSPYDEIFDFNGALELSYEPLSVDYLNNQDHIKVKVIIKNEIIRRNIELMKIDKAYELHTDYVQELIRKAKLYDKVKIEEYLRVYSDLFYSKEEILRIIFGNYIQEKDHGKRPLAKLTVNILKELGIDLGC